MVSFVKKLVPRSAKAALRSVRVAHGLELLPEYFKTLKNARRALRVGSSYGGWVIPVDRLSRDSVCYCVGCGEDISFDLGLISRYGCNVWAFDPTPRAIAYVRDTTRAVRGYHFEPTALWDHRGTVSFFVPENREHVSHSITNLQKSADAITVPCDRLSNIARANGHTHIALLKLDIEGAERTVLETMLEDGVVVDVLLVEFDELGRPTGERWQAVKRCVEQLLGCGFELFWIDGLNFTFVRTS